VKGCSRGKGKTKEKKLRWIQEASESLKVSWFGLALGRKIALGPETNRIGCLSEWGKGVLPERDDGGESRECSQRLQEKGTIFGIKERGFRGLMGAHRHLSGESVAGNSCRRWSLEELSPSRLRRLERGGLWKGERIGSQRVHIQGNITQLLATQLRAPVSENFTNGTVRVQ